MSTYHFNTFHCPRWEELPNLGLYMDQVLIVVEGALRPLFPSDPVLLTATMVNNYVKQQILPPSEKKKYGRNHLATLITITLLKRVLSVAEMGVVLRVLSQTREPAEGYDLLCDQLEHRLTGRAGLDNCDPLLAAAVDAVAGKLIFESKCAELSPAETGTERKKHRAEGRE